LSVLFVTFVPGLICSIIGLVLNAGYNKKGLVNPRKTSTLAIGIVGIVVAVLCLITTIAVGVIAAQVAGELDRQGIDITTDSVSVSTDSSGHINISVADGSSSAASAGSSALSGSASTSSSAASPAASSSALSVYEDSKYHDSEWNPTLYSIVELTGSEMADLLEYYNFKWDSSYGGWTASDGSLYSVSDSSGELSESKVRALPKGAAGQPVVLSLWAEGYETPSAAFKALTKDIVTEEVYEASDAYFGIVYGSPMVRYLVITIQTANNEQMLLLFTEEAISTGYFNTLLDVTAGLTMDVVWKNSTKDASVANSIS
ncbi:MAG: hypothetical protein IJ087_07750, partial [Eggerthellaceae bacterium]|nr:hypothetical protein [Eggerthellaceae bacterium]